MDVDLRIDQGRAGILSSRAFDGFSSGHHRICNDSHVLGKRNSVSDVSLLTLTDVESTKNLRAVLRDFAGPKARSRMRAQRLRKGHPQGPSANRGCADENIMTTTNTIDPLDPHGLVAKGEALATSAELAGLLRLSRSEVETLLHRELAGRVRFVRTFPGGGKWRYSVADAKAAIAPLLPTLAEARRRRAELQAKDQADAVTRKTERQAAQADHLARKKAGAQKDRPASTRPRKGESAPASSQPTSSRRHPPARAAERPTQNSPVGPEVIVRRQFNAG